MLRLLNHEWRHRETECASCGSGLLGASYAKTYLNSNDVIIQSSILDVGCTGSLADIQDHESRELSSQRGKGGHVDS